MLFRRIKHLGPAHMAKAQLYGRGLVIVILASYLKQNQTSEYGIRLLHKFRLFQDIVPVWIYILLSFETKKNIYIYKNSDFCCCIQKPNIFQLPVNVIPWAVAPRLVKQSLGQLLHKRLSGGVVIWSLSNFVPSGDWGCSIQLGSGIGCFVNKKSV